MLEQVSGAVFGVAIFQVGLYDKVINNFRDRMISIIADEFVIHANERTI